MDELRCDVPIENERCHRCLNGLVAMGVGGNGTLVRDFMLVRISTAGMKATRWYEFVLRFLLGGLVTAIAGIIANRTGPVLGGLFLAFPAISAASLTLIAKHEERRKKEKGQARRIRGRQAAGADAAGAIIGSFALALFALIIWRCIERHSAAWVIGLGTVAWLCTSLVGWWCWKGYRPR